MRFFRPAVLPIIMLAIATTVLAHEERQTRGDRNPSPASEDRRSDLLSRNPLRETIEPITASSNPLESPMASIVRLRRETPVAVARGGDPGLNLPLKPAALLPNAAGQTASPAAPPGSESDLVSNFDDLKVSARYGAWMVTSDQEMGGKSTARMQAVEGGANGSKGALEVTGEIVPGADFTWAGVFFYPGSSPDESVDLSRKKTFAFWAKGDGSEYAVAVRTESNTGQMPVIKAFVAGPEWKQYQFSLSDFQTDGHDVKGIGFARAQQPGKFTFELDELEIK